jgi:mRNA interferase MazF
MPNTTAYRFGDLVLVPFAFTDQTGIRKRPAIVVSSDAYQSQRPDVVLMAVTSQLLRPAGAVGEVLITEWQKTGLPKASLIKPVLTTLEKRPILRRLGELQEPDRTALRQALTAILGQEGGRRLTPRPAPPGFPTTSGRGSRSCRS